MTQPPGGYPPPDPREQPQRPADPFAPPSWSQPGGPGQQPPVPGQPDRPTQPIPPPPSYPPASPAPSYPPPPPGGPYGASAPGPYSPQPGSYLPQGAALPYPGAYPPGPPPRRRGPVIAAVAIVLALLVVGGGGVATWLLTRDPDRDGAASPPEAVESFLQAVYHDQDAAAAADLVCSEARDEVALETKINEIRSYQQTLVNPTFSWTPPEVVDQGEELAVVQVTVSMVTGDEQTSDQTLQVSVLDKGENGWWVCELASVETATTPPAGDESGGEPSPTPSQGG